MATEGDDVINVTGPAMVDALGGDDTITAEIGFSPSPIIVNGGSGFDILNLTVNQVTAGAQADQIFARGDTMSKSGDVSWTNIERFVLSATHITAVFGAADDWITSRRGTDSASNISTGAGNDRVVLLDLQVGAIIDLGDGDDLVDLTGSAPTSNGVFQVQGGQGNDTMLGSSYRDEFYGGMGNDILDGRGSVASQQPDLLVGGDGDDVYYAYGRETIVEQANEGDDEVRTALSSYVLPTNVERLTLLGTAGGGGQTATANSGDNVVNGSGGSDIFYMQQGGNDRVFGNGGTDYFYFGAAYSYGGDRVIGGDGYDFLILQGNYSGNAPSGPSALNIASTVELQVESIVLLSGYDTRYGGATGTPLNYDLTVQSAAVPPGGALEIHAAGLAANEQLTFVGNTASDAERFTVYGGAGADRITTSFGNDNIDGGAGADIMAGGQGNDIYFVDDPFDIVQEYSDGGYDTVYTSTSYTLRSASGLAASNVEMLATRDSNGTAALTLEGNSLNNRIIGNAGNNNLDGLGGIDTLYGGAGSDNLFGGDGDFLFGEQGDDIYWVYNPFDRAIERAGEGFDALYTSVSYKPFDDSDIELIGTTDANSTAALVLSGSSIKNTIIGNAGNNNIFGEGGDDTLYGLAGSDYLDGGTGADAMDGGLGDDVYIVDHVGDIVVERVSEGFDQVYVTSNYALGVGSSIELLGTVDNAGTASLALTGNDEGQTIAGNAGNNLLLGLGGSDNLIGGAGDDLLDGGTGYDVHTGGAGSDTFRFSDTDGAGPANAIGWITDFAAEDLIDLSLIDANRNTAGDDSFTFLGNGAFSGTAGQLRYDVLGSTYRFFGDTDGDGVADFYFDVNGAQPLTADLVL